ncbi:hypothetical protein [Frigoribacterium faeni]|jgi:TRAP-type mannitol/chloroaromatic compound transport system permease large subunit|uniref:hypothetical protein n=1 Tax=Frigoribacterium faeni TaxID=145483 RepID=UPI00141BDA63|nr:hypothetical protein [Frigoribacterium faeni]NIJ05691.1 TRAP-type mannitol/chloroaromatic compound transport system permease large subunit [Frigoribacterium faeni]
MDTGRSRMPEAPGGVVGAWFNVLVCTAIVVAAPIYAVTTGVSGADLVIALGVVAVGIGLEVYFVRALLSQLRRRRERRE